MMSATIASVEIPLNIPIKATSKTYEKRNVYLYVVVLSIQKIRKDKFLKNV